MEKGVLEWRKRGGEGGGENRGVERERRKRNVSDRAGKQIRERSPRQQLLSSSSSSSSTRLLLCPTLILIYEHLDIRRGAVTRARRHMHGINQIKHFVTK